MNATELIKIKRDYEKVSRSASVHRYVAMEEFRMSYPNDFGFRFDPTTMDIPHEEVGRRLQILEDKIMLVEKFLSKNTLSREELVGLGVDEAEFEAVKGQYYPLKKEIPDGLIIMTFDDSLIDHYTKAAPVLEEFGAKGSFFTCETKKGMDGGTGFEDKGRYMTWEQISELANRGHEIANHTMNHDFGFIHQSEETKTREIEALAKKCAVYGIAEPVVFGYPGGVCDQESVELVASLGYHWARGDLVGTGRVGQNVYDPLVDCPLAIPGFNGAPMFADAQLERVVEQAKDGRVAVLAYHGIDNGDFGRLSFRQQLECIYRAGGRCVSFADLEEYIDPLKAYKYWKL